MTILTILAPFLAKSFDLSLTPQSFDRETKICGVQLGPKNPTPPRSKNDSFSFYPAEFFPKN